ncbi:hypothetical protein [Brevundimonas sp.]|jgi:hypothetical protein|uniref:hypothetical protein n=1 Tax=Brevundimonas sp. TaxID=1871086 RepID=UPI0028B0B34E|nr:hypothetical protein [Brevundimonas sp.]
MNRVLILSALLMAGCTPTPKPVPEPVVRIVEVKVPVAVACDPDIGPEPAYVDTPEAIAAAPDIFARTVLLVAGRVQRIARDGVKTAALDGCRRPPVIPPRPG